MSEENKRRQQDQAMAKVRTQVQKNIANRAESIGMRPEQHRNGEIVEGRFESGFSTLNVKLRGATPEIDLPNGLTCQASRPLTIDLNYRETGEGQAASPTSAILSRPLTSRPAADAIAASSLQIEAMSGTTLGYDSDSVEVYLAKRKIGNGQGLTEEESESVRAANEQATNKSREIGLNCRATDGGEAFDLSQLDLPSLEQFGHRAVSQAAPPSPRARAGRGR